MPSVYEICMELFLTIMASVSFSPYPILKQDKAMRVTLFHNPAAGKGETSKEELLRMLREAGHQVIYQSTDEDDYQMALEDLGDWVMLVGGDGTVGKVVPLLVGREVAVGLLPGGTANNIARTLNLQEKWQEVINGWSAGRTRPFDVGLAEGFWGQTHFIEAIGAGLFPRLIKKAEAEKKKKVHSLSTPAEELEFILHLLFNLLKDYTPSSYRITLDGEDLSGDYLLVEAMNIRSIGPNLDLAPMADPGDGHLDLVLLTEQDRPALQHYVQERLAGKKPVHDFRVRRGRKLHLTWDGSEMHIDDGLKEPSTGSLVVSFPYQPLHFLI